MTLAEELRELDSLNYGDMPEPVARRALHRRGRLQRKLDRDPLGVFIRRLETRQRDLEARVGRYLLHAADSAGEAAARRAKQGDDEPMAAIIQRGADAATSLAERFDAHASRLTLRIANLKRRREFGLAIVDLLDRKGGV